MRRHGKSQPTHAAASVRLLAILCLAIAATAALGAAPAFAETTRLYTGTSFGPDGVGGSAAFENPQAVTVDPATGDIYVLDAGEGGRLYKFDDTGQPSNYASLSGNVIEGVGGSPYNAENEIAIAPPGSPGGTAGDIYLANNSGAFQIYAASGAKLGEVETGGETCGIAVDPSGHLFVGVYPSTIIEYTPSANPPTALDQTATGTAEVGLCNVATDGLGNIYASNFFGGSTARLEGLADATPTLIEPGGAALAIDPSTDDLYLDEGSSVAVYTSTGEPKEHFGSGLSESHGVAVGAAAETIYVTNRGTGKVDLYGPSLILPGVTTEPATGIGPESATLNGTISAAGGPEASCEFQLTTEKAFKAEGFTGATSVPCEPSSVTGSGVEAVSATVSDLSPGTHYRFRVRSTNSNGASVGAALSFLTEGPSVIASGATGVTARAATVTGLINPNGDATTYHVEYGFSESYGSSVPVPDASAVVPVASGRVRRSEAIDVIREVRYAQGMFVVGQEVEGEGIPDGTVITKVEGSPASPKGTPSTPLNATTLTLSAGVAFAGPETEITLTSPSAAVSQRLTGLTPGTLYHFRIVAENSASATGPDGSFMTFFQAPGAGSPAYEMVSPAEKIGEVFPPEPRTDLGGACPVPGEYCLPGVNSTMMPMQATADGESLAYEGQPFTSGLSPAGNQYIGKRSSEGWGYSAITPPSAPGVADASGFKGFSADLSRGVLLQTRPKLSAEAPGEGQQSFSNLYRWEAGNPDLRPLVTVEPPNRDPGLPGESNAFDVSFAGGNAGTTGVPAFEHLVFEANDALTAAVPGVAPSAPEVAEGHCEGFPASDCNLYEWAGGGLRLVNVLPGNTEAASGATIGSGRRLAASLASKSTPDSQAPNADHAISDDGSRIFWSDASGQVYVRINGTETVELNDPGQFLTAAPDGSKALLADGCLYDLAAGACEGGEPLGNAAGFLGIMGASEDLSRIYFLSTESLATGAIPGTCETAASQIPAEEEEEGRVPPGLGCNLYAYDNGAVSFVAALHKRDNNFAGFYGDWKASKSNRTAQVTPDGRYLAFMSYAQLTGYENRVVGGGNCKEAIGKPCFEVYEYDLEAGNLSCASCNPSGQRPLGLSNLSLIRPAPAASFPQPENLPAEGEGRVFFESQDTLTSTDTNGHIQDVYEWTPNGVGGCTRTSGCVALVSSGHSANDSMFVTATPDAKNAFFITREQLLAQDQDDLLDVYDARLGGGIPPGGIASCGAEGCKGPIAPAPSPPASGSSQFNGPGNPRHHKKKHHKRKHHKKKHHHKQQRQHRANDNRGGAK